MKIYKTSDLYVASFLHYKKIDLASLEVETNKGEAKITFIFRDSKEKEDLIRAFYTQAESSYVLAREFRNSIFDIKNMIFEIKRNGKQDEQPEGVKNETIEQGASIKQ